MGVTSNTDQWRRWTPVAVVTTLLAVAVAGNIASSVDQMSRSGRTVALLPLVIDELTSAAAWLTVLPIIAWASTRLLPPRAPLVRTLTGYAAFIPLMSLAHYLLTRLMRGFVSLIQGEGFEVVVSRSGYIADLYRDVLTCLLLGVVYAGAVRLLARRIESEGVNVTPPPPLEIRDGAQTTYLALNDILWIEAAGNYAQIHTRNGRVVLMRSTLARLTERLDDAGFIRIHRSRLVNAAAVTGMENLPAGDALLNLCSGAEILASRRYRPHLISRLSARSNGRPKGEGARVTASR